MNWPLDVNHATSKLLTEGSPSNIRIFRQSTWHIHVNLILCKIMMLHILAYHRYSTNTHYIYHARKININHRIRSQSRCYHSHIWINIYNGNIFPSLNPAKIFQVISRWTESTKSSAVGPNHRAVINTSNEVKSPLLWEFWINDFSLRILERVLCWKHCKYKEWVSFFLGSWGMNRSAEQTNRPRTASRFTRFVCPVLRFIPPWTQKKRHSFLKWKYHRCNNHKI